MRAVALILTLFPLVVQAQMHGVEFVADPLMSTSSGSVTGCGLMFTATHVDSATGSVVGLTGSVNVYLSGVSAIKGGLFDFTGSGSGEITRKAAPHKLTWVRADGGAVVKPKRPEHVQPSDDEGFVLFAVPGVDAGFDLLERVKLGSRLWVGFKSDLGKERIFSGPVKMDQATTDQMTLCYRELAESAQRTLDGSMK